MLQIKKQLSSVFGYLSHLPIALFFFVTLGVIFSSSASILLIQNHFSSNVAILDQASLPAHFQLADATNLESVPSSTKPTGQVLGYNNEVNFVSNQGRSMNEGVIVLSSSVDPVVEISAYNFSQELSFNLYKITHQDLLNYLLYSQEVDEQGYSAQLKKLYQFDPNQLELVSSFNQWISSSSNSRDIAQISLPLEQEGIWYLEGSYQGEKIKTVLLRSSIAGLGNKTDNKITFWVQDVNKKHVANAKIELLNTQDKLTSLGEISTNDQGLSEVVANDAADIALISYGSSLTIVPLNLTGFTYRSLGNSFYSSFGPRKVGNKSFIFTDRFLYKPGDKIYFKAIIRDDDDAKYTLPSGQVRVTLSGGQDRQATIYESELLIDDLGTIDDQINLPADVEVGYYNLTVYDGDNYLTGASFQVAEFHKPDSEVSLSLDKYTYFPGDKLKARVSGSYFLGQPLSGQVVKYKIYQNSSHLSGDYQNINFSSTLSYYGEGQVLVAEGSLQLDKNGVADLELEVVNQTGYRQLWAIVLEYVDAGGAATNDGGKVLVNPGDFVIEKNFTDNNSQSHVVNQNITISLVLQPTKPNVDLNKIDVSAQAYDQNNQSQRVAVGEAQQLTTDLDGKMSFSFTPTQTGGHELELEAHDKHKNLIKGDVSFYVQAYENTNSSANAETISLTTDKESYYPGETATITLDPSFDSQDMFVYVGRSYAKDYQVLMNGTKQFSLVIPEDYQPNVSLNVGSFVGDNWVFGSQDIEVKTADKQLNLTFSFDQETYGPAQTAVVDILVKDDLGNPVQTDIGLWVFDKALLELNKDNYGGVFKRFWGRRYASPLLNHSFEGLTSAGAEGGGGCFAAKTLVLMADSSLKEISQIEAGDWIKTLKSSDSSELVSAQVIDTHQVNVDGYLVINGELKITPEHKLLVNNKWQTAGQLQIGDELTTVEGNSELVSSIEWVRGKFAVYNLTVDKFHTFIANGVYVHNDKGDSRSVFKDTAYWNPHVTTDNNGQAKVTIQLPDNLTTWVIAGVAANQKTQVGSSEDEFIVTKELVVRPVTPSFLRQGDDLVLSALINNFTDQDLKLDVTADLDIADLQDSLRSLTVPAKDLSELGWQVQINSLQSPATFHVKAQETGEGGYIDEVFIEIPVYEYGFWQESYLLGENQQAYDLPVSIGVDPERTQTALTLKASRYPNFKSDWQNILLTQNIHTSTLPSVLSMAAVGEKLGTELGLEHSSAQNKEIAQTALNKLTKEIESAYLWNSYDRAKSNLDILEALVFAKEAGIEVNQVLIDRFVSYFSNWSSSEYGDQALQQYALSLVSGSNSHRKELIITSSADSEPTILAIMANYQNEFVDVATTKEQILGVKFENEYQLSWPANTKNGFNGVYKNSLRASAALIELQADQKIVEKGLDYLYRNRGQQASYELIKALTAYYSLYTQPNQKLNYAVLLNDQPQDSDTLVASNDQIKELSLSSVDGEVNQLQINHSGEAKLYSQLRTTEFITDKEIKNESHHLEISRKYLSANNSDDPVKVGDMVIVEFKVKNLGLGERDLEIIDYLPSGLVAIDQSLDNGVFEKVETNRVGQQKISGQTVELKINYTNQDMSIFRYKTRVVSQGVFDTPPAVVKHTAQPSLWARSDSTRLVIDGRNKLEMLNTNNEQPSLANHSAAIPWGYVMLGIGIGLSSIGYGVWINRAEIIAKLRKMAPPDETKSA